MNTPSTRRRRPLARRLSWLVVAAMTATALFATPGIALGHDAVVTCGGFLNLDFPSRTADIIRTDVNPDVLVYDNVDGGGTYAVVPGSYTIRWSDGFAVNKVVGACPEGSLKITKTISGDKDAFAGGTFWFSIDCGPDGLFTRSIVLEPGITFGTTLIAEIAAGATCTLTETTKADPGSEFNWGTEIISPNPVTIVSGQTVTIAVENPRQTTPPPPTCEELQNCETPPPPTCEELQNCETPPPPTCEELQNCETPPPTPTPTPPVIPCTAANNCTIPTPTPDPTPTPTPTPVVTPTPTPTETPTGEVEGATGTPPGAVLPATDTLTGNPATPSNDGWRLILLAMAGLLAVTLLLTPAESVVRRRDR